MDPVSVGLLAALAGGAGGEVGRQAWAQLTALVRRPFQAGDGGQAAVRSGEMELTRLEQDPDDHERAHALSTALAVRSALEPDFQVGLEAWRAQAMLVRTGDGAVNNNVSGGTQHGPVLQGRDFSGFTYTTSSPPVIPPSGRQTSDPGEGANPAGRD